MKMWWQQTEDDFTSLLSPSFQSPIFLWMIHLCLNQMWQPHIHYITRLVKKWFLVDFVPISLKSVTVSDSIDHVSIDHHNLNNFLFILGFIQWISLKTALSSYKHLRNDLYFQLMFFKLPVRTTVVWEKWIYLCVCHSRQV